MPLRLTVLGSGSNGNAAYLETDTTRLLVDAGLSTRQITERLAAIGRDPATLHAILITHEHSDHVQGLRLLATKWRIPVYANRLTREAVLDEISEGGTRPVPPIAWKVFENGQPFAAGDFDVEPFSIPHDASDPVGFLVQAGGHAVAFVTDLGHVTRLVADKARRAQTLLLETNHDLKMLQDDPHRPWSVKQRIGGRHGHLSNEAAALALPELMNDRLERIFLSHLSRDCNRPPLAEEAIGRKLDDLGLSASQAGASRPRVILTSQLQACPTETLGGAAVPRQETAPLFGQPVSAPS